MRGGDFLDAFGDFHLGDLAPDGQDRVDRRQPLHEGPFIRRLDVHHGLIGLHLIDRLVSADAIAGVLEHGNESGLLEALSDLRDSE
jgi:hypothetical protein